MRRPGIAAVALLLFTAPGTATSTATGPPERQVAIRTALQPQAFAADEAFGHVRRLAGRIGPRPAGSRAYRRAVQYVADEFTALGYDTRLQRFGLGRGSASWNVIALPSGADTSRLLVGAHLDTVPGSPGGNDNASGVSVLLEVARVLAGSTSVEGLGLVTFGAEEFQPSGEHHIGSAAYVRRMTAEARDALDLMVSVDMVGKVRRFIAGHLRGLSPSAARELARAVRTSGARARVAGLGDISDHGPFALAGMPAAFLWTGDEPNHHRPTDVVRNVRRRALRRSGHVILELITRVLGAP
jgi:hypothetical protein